MLQVIFIVNERFKSFIFTDLLELCFILMFYALPTVQTEKLQYCIIFFSD